MIHIAFILSMPNVGSWNGKWTGADGLYVKVRSYPNKSDITSKVLTRKAYYYDFGDGWGASVKCEKVDAKRKQTLKKNSQDFCGYDWMIDEIEQFGRIKTVEERRQERVLGERSKI